MIYSAKNKKQASAVELVNMLQVALSDANFVMDYQLLHPVADDVDILIQSVPKMLVHHFKLLIKQNCNAHTNMKMKIIIFFFFIAAIK